MFDIDKLGCLEHYRGDSPYVVVTENVRVITTYAFKGRTDIKEVVISDKFKVIQERAFMYCTSL